MGAGLSLGVTVLLAPAHGVAFTAASTVPEAHSRCEAGGPRLSSLAPLAASHFSLFFFSSFASFFSSFFFGLLSALASSPSSRACPPPRHLEVFGGGILYADRVVTRAAVLRLHAEAKAMLRQVT